MQCLTSKHRLEILGVVRETESVLQEVLQWFYGALTLRLFPEMELRTNILRTLLDHLVTHASAVSDTEINSLFNFAVQESELQIAFDVRGCAVPKTTCRPPTCSLTAAFTHPAHQHFVRYCA